MKYIKNAMLIETRSPIVSTPETKTKYSKYNSFK